MLEDYSSLDLLLSRFPELTVCRADIVAAYQLLADCYDHGGCVFTCGNGGSAADAEHIVGELLKGFVRKRPLNERDRQIFTAAGADGAVLAERLQYGLRAVCLMSQLAISTAVANDLGGDLGPAQQLFALGQPGDVLIALSTSGNAANVRYAMEVARQRGLHSIGLSAGAGGQLAQMAEVCIRVPAKETYLAQEYHLPIYHCLCIMLEARYFPK
ncbi:MAG: SIS domain-containing protein [Oligosphaeraceae bacterium]|nr:SIS domain-containing protein [Oligosphaeraceae bacterium]